MPDYVNKKFEVIGDLVLSGTSVSEIFEYKINPPPVQYVHTTFGTLTGSEVTIPEQQLTLSGAELTITGGNTVDLTNIIPDVDVQTLDLSGTQLSIDRGNSVDLANLIPEIDIQNLTFTGTQLSIDRGNTVDLSTLNQTLSVSGTELSISDGNTVDLAFLAEELDDQTLSLSGNDLSISNGNTVDLSSMSQTLSLSGTEMTISDGNTVDLAFLAEELDDQTLSLSGNTLTISNGNSIDLGVVQSEAVAPIFVTSITNNNGLIQPTYITGTVPVDMIVSAITVDDDSDLDITVEWDGPTDEWMGTATINDVAISLSDIERYANTRRFYATVNVDLDGAEQIVVAANGSTHTVDVTLLGQGPAITDVSFGPLPTYGGSQQAMFLDGDTVQVTLTFDSEDVSSISLDGGNDTATSNINNMSVTPVNVGDGTSTFTFDATIDTSLSTTTDVPIKVSAKNSFGTEGDEHTSVATIPVRQGPEITDVTFGTYPGSQTELKDNDTIQMTVTFDTNNISQVQLQGGGSYASASQTKSVTPATLQATTTITIDTSVTTAQDQPVRIRARGGNNNYGNYVNSTNTLKVNNAGATYSGLSVSYPTDQSALKGTETADVTLTISTVGSSPTYTYSTPRSEITIPDTSSYSETKTVTCTNPGVYNISSNNFSVSVNRAENDKTTSFSGVVKVVDTLPTISVSTPGSMRSGGDENTSPQTYQVTVTSDQQLSSFDLQADANGGTLLGSWQGSNSNRTWTRNLQVSDADSKGTFTWQNLAAENLADVTQSTISSGSTYVLAGFVARTLTMSALSRTRALGTNVNDPTKLTISETFRGPITFDSSIADGTTIDPDISTGIDVANKYTIVDSSSPTIVDYDGDTFFYLDRVAVNNNVSGTSVITVEETT